MSLCWAALDVTRKALSAGQPPLQVSAQLQGLSSLVFLAASALVEGWPGPLPLRYAGPLLLAAGIGAAGSSLMLHALRQGALSLVVPLMALTPAISALGAALLLGQWPGPLGWLGLALVPAGALLAAQRPEGSGLAPGAAAMLGVTLLWSLSPVVDQLALRDAPPALHAGLSLLLASLGQTGLLWAQRRGRAAEGPPPPLRLGLLFAAVGLFFAAYSLQLMALARHEAGVVEGAKRAIGLTAAVLVGRLRFGEALRPPRLLGLALLLLGATLTVGTARPRPPTEPPTTAGEPPQPQTAAPRP